MRKLRPRKDSVICLRSQGRYSHQLAEVWTKVSLTPEPELVLLCPPVTPSCSNYHPRGHRSCSPCFHLYLTLHGVVWTPILCNNRIWAPCHFKDHLFLTSWEQRGACFLFIPEPVSSSAYALSSLCGRPPPGIDTSFSLPFPKARLILCV